MTTEDPNFFKSRCIYCEVNVEVPNELYSSEIQCPACSRGFLAIPIQELPPKILPKPFPRKVKPAIPHLRCPFCGSDNIGQGQKKLTTGGIILVVIALFLVFFVIGILLLIVANGMREIKYTCGNCRKTF